MKDNERIDDLQIENLKIIQNKEGFCFGIDSVLLSDFAKEIKKNSKLLDLGTGTGILPILLSAKTEYKKAIGVEIQEEVADMAKRSIQLNRLEGRIEIINENILNLKNKYNKGSFDVVISNPPYKKINTGIQNEDSRKNISRHEITATLEDFIQTTKMMLKDKGEFYMVHRSERLVDILYLLRKYKLEPKELTFVAKNKDTAPKLVMIKSIKNANSFLITNKTLNIYDEKGNYTNEVLRIYGKEEK